MANIRALATAGLLVTLASGASIATSPQDMAARGKVVQERYPMIRSGLSALIVCLADNSRNMKKSRGRQAQQIGRLMRPNRQTAVLRSSPPIS